MKNRLILAAFLTAGIGASPWCVQAEMPNEANVGVLVKALSSPSAAKRADAEKELLEFGPAVLPFLPESVRSPEAQMRLNRVRIQLERQTAEDSLEAGRVTLEAGTPTDEIAEKIVQQTQNQVEFTLPDGSVYPPRDEENGVQETGKIGERAAVPFWEFLDSFCDEFQLEPQTMTGRKGLRLVRSYREMPRNAAENERIAYLGPFRLEPLKTTSTLLLASDAPGTILQLELAWEPRIQPVFAYLTLTEAEFFDAQGRPVGAEGDSAEESGTAKPLKLPSVEQEILIGQSEFRAVCDLPLPGRKIPAEARFVTLRGNFSAVACGTKKDFTFGDLALKLDRPFPPETQRTASVLVTMTDLRSEKVFRETETRTDEKPAASRTAEDGNAEGRAEENAEGSTENTAEKSRTVQEFLTVSIRYRYEEPHDALESHRTWIYENEAELRHPDGRSIPAQRSELRRQTPNEIALDLYFPADPEILEDLSGWEIVYPRPGGIYEVGMPFELKQLPLP
ncbi:MAG: hypothetical protein J6J31_02465 [Thermoguttaceae bacterium]|nr:hypothetical protein [Thermoguttaceae bacterium]